jgi:hypothetical protein
MKILHKYANGKDVDSADDCILREMALIGLMNIGLSIKRKTITAKTTDVGLGLSGNFITRML